MTSYGDHKGDDFKKAPYWTGSFNNFAAPVKMLPLREYTSAIDKQKPEFIEQLKTKRWISQGATSYNFMKPYEKQAYKENLPEYIKSYEPNRWQ